jgi:hypothetical protein
MGRRVLISGLLTVAALTQMHAAGAQSTSPPFPRLGGYLIAGSVQSSFGTSSYQQKVAKLDAAVIGTYPGWTSGGFNMQSAAAAVKAINPNIKLVPYTNIMELEAGVGSSGSAYSPVYNAASAANWFLRVTSPGGTVTDAGGLHQMGLNQTTFTNVWSGQNYLQWRAAWTAAHEFPSNWDGIFLDNVFYQPRVSADYDESGTTQSPSAAGQNWRNGYAAYVHNLRAALPAGSQVWGNTADWGNGSISGYDQMLNGGVMESIIGQSYSYESQGWAAMMKAYRIVMNATTPNGYQIFEQDGTAGDYQGMRYGLTSCLMDNGYYYFNVTGPGGGSVITWFDEFDTSLGQATSQPPTTAWQNGVYRRDFQNGIALVNPKGNGPRTVTLETSYKHISGTQAPSVNNGQTVTTVTLNDRDGVILLRTAQQPVPDAPTLTVQ